MPLGRRIGGEAGETERERGCRRDETGIPHLCISLCW
jgi:hypothetical protein